MSTDRTGQGRVVYWNGRMIPEHEARISIYDSSLMFGDMVFEMTRSFKKRQFKLREHIERLYASAKAVRIPVPLTLEEMEQAVHATIEANDPVFSADDEMSDATLELVSRAGIRFEWFLQSVRGE